MGAVWLAIAAAMLLHPRDGGAPQGFLLDAPVYMSFLQREENQTVGVGAALANRSVPARALAANRSALAGNRSALANRLAVAASAVASAASAPVASAALAPGSGLVLAAPAAAPAVAPAAAPAAFSALQLRAGAPPASAAPASNTSVEALLDLSEQVLQTTASLLPTLAGSPAAAEPAGAAGKQERRQEEQALGLLADHSGQLEKLFRQLSDGLEQQDDEGEEAKEVRALTPDPALRLAGLAKTAVAEEEDALRVQAQGDHVLHLFSEAAPEAHLHDVAGIGEDEPLSPAVATSLAQRAASLGAEGPPVQRPLATAPGAPERAMRQGQVGVAGARVSVGLLVLTVVVVGAAAWLVLRRLEDSAKPGAKAEDSAKPNPVPGEAEGKTSYVVRIVRVKVEPRPLRAPALAWQIKVGDQQPRPSRFAQTWVWDSGVDRIDVDVDNPAERIQVQILEQSRELLDPPTVRHEVEIPAGVLLAEARRNVEKVKSARQADQFVHEKRLALPGGGYLVLEYSLIAFFHWYVGGDGR